MNTEQKAVLLQWLAKQTSPIDSMLACRIVHCDWHKVGDYLEELVRKELVKRLGVGRDGMTLYQLNREA